MPAPRHLRPVARPRAAAEGLFHRIRAEVEKIAETLSNPFEEIINFLGRVQQKYLVNFSIFQSIPDAWSIDPVFPAAVTPRVVRNICPKGQPDVAFGAGQHDHRGRP